MNKPTGFYIHHTQLSPSAEDGPQDVEWETYRRVVGDLLAAGHEGKYVVIKGAEVVGLWTTDREAYRAGATRLPGQPFLLHRVAEWEPINRFGWLTFGKLLKEEIAHAADDRPARSRSADNSAVDRTERG
jgi:hypothetical protein